MEGLSTTVRVHSGTQLSISHGSKTDLFTFDHVGGPETAQDEVFFAVGKSISDNCLEGYNGTIFAYGQTGTAHSDRNFDRFRFRKDFHDARSFRFPFGPIGL